MLEVNGTYHFPLQHKKVPNEYGVLQQVKFTSEMLEIDGILKSIFVQGDVGTLGIKVTEDMLQSMPFKLIVKEKGISAQEIDLGWHELVKQEDLPLSKALIEVTIAVATHLIPRGHSAARSLQI